MTVLVLGGSGFLGSWALRALLAEGLPVVTVCRPSSDRFRIPDGARVIAADPSSWPDVIRRVQADVLLSLDWQGVAGAARDDPGQADNAGRLRPLYDAAVDGGARLLIGVGSQAEFGPRGLRIPESAPPAPVTEYGRAKDATRRMLEEVGELRGVGVTWARVFSTFGPLDHAYWLLPTIATAIMSGSPVPLTAGEQRWSYLEASDAGRAFAALVSAGRGLGTVNVGHPDAPQLRQVVEEFAAGFSRPADLEFGALPYGENQVMHLEPDVSTLLSLGWEPDVPLADGLAQTARWWQGLPTRDRLLGGTLPQSRGLG